MPDKNHCWFPLNNDQYYRLLEAYFSPLSIDHYQLLRDYAIFGARTLSCAPLLTFATTRCPVGLSAFVSGSISTSSCDHDDIQWYSHPPITVRSGDLHCVSERSSPLLFRTSSQVVVLPRRHMYSHISLWAEHSSNGRRREGARRSPAITIASRLLKRRGVNVHVTPFSRSDEGIHVQKLS